MNLPRNIVKEKFLKLPRCEQAIHRVGWELRKMGYHLDKIKFHGHGEHWEFKSSKKPEPGKKEAGK